MVAGVVAVILLHGSLMLRALLGHIYAQQDVVTFLLLLLATCCGFTAYAFIKGVPAGLTLLPILATVLAAFVFSLSRSANFTLFAELMRVKRLYLKEHDKQRHALRKPVNRRR